MWDQLHLRLTITTQDSMRHHRCQRFHLGELETYVLWEPPDSHLLDVPQHVPISEVHESQPPGDLCMERAPNQSVPATSRPRLTVGRRATLHQLPPPRRSHRYRGACWYPHDITTHHERDKDKKNATSSEICGLHHELVTAFEVEALIRKINVSKSLGITMLSSKILKDFFQVLSDKLTYLFNFSIRATSFPDQWKNAVVIPIPKQGDSKVGENYRPISLLPIPGKKIEKLIHTQLSFYLEENELLTEHQFGFRKQRSTSHAISDLHKHKQICYNYCSIYWPFQGI